MLEAQTYSNKIVWIIGASSGIGEALSKELASRGAILCLSARRDKELENLKNSLVGARHEIFPLDVSNPESIMDSARAINTHFGCINSIILLAAAYKPMRLEGLDMAYVRQIIETNLLSPFYVLHAVLPILKNQRHGQIALCGSAAGYMGLPGGQPYSATKAAIINLAESLRSELGEMLDVKIINPGFVKTDLTAKNTFSMPMIITPKQAATHIADGLLSKNFEIHFPKRFTFFLKVMQLLPYALSTKIMARFNVKELSSC